MGMGNFVAGTDGDDIVLAGGISWKNDTKLWLDQTWRFDAKKATWTEGAKLPHPMAYAAFAQLKDQIYFSGGSDGKVTTNDFCQLSTKLDLKKIAKIEKPLVYSATAIAGSKQFIIAGGGDAVDLKTLTNIVYSIDLASGKTEALPDFPGGNLIVPTAAAIGGQLYVFTGGYIDTNAQAVNVNSAFAYNINNRTWKKINPYPLAVRGLASCALDDRYILLGGGYTNGFSDVSYLYDTKTDAYLKNRPLPYPAMATFLKTGDNLYWLGGEDKMRHRSELVYVTKWRELLKAIISE
ncbi:MAG: galactose oxidase [Verrucomicrobiales bacterium]|nr:galactose oxidase [Verrucomicrobiales bacterium]